MLGTKEKVEKFAKVKDQLPAHIIDLHDNQAKKASSPRDFRTTIINKLFTKLPNGQYQINSKDQMFEEHKMLVEKKFGKDEHQAYPKSIMRGKYFKNNNDALNDAVRDGSVQVTLVDGQEFYAFRTLRTGTEKAAVTTQSVKGSHKISMHQYQMMA